MHYFQHPACVVDHLICATGPASQRLWPCMAVAELRWFFWRARRWQASESDSITLAAPVSPRTLNAARLHVKVESITILTESPVLNWPCTVFASRRYNEIRIIRCHGPDWRWEHACTGAAASRACVAPEHGQGTQGSGRGRTRGAALGSTDRWVQQLVAGKVQTNRMSIAPADHG